MADHAGLHVVIEGHGAVLELVLKVYVGRPIAEMVGDLGQCEVVRRDQTDGPQIDESGQHGLGANASIVGIGALEKLIEKKQERRLAAGQIDELADAGDLGIETRASCLERILDP